MRPTGRVCVLSSPGPGALALLEVSGPGVIEFSNRHLRYASPELARDWPIGRVLRAGLLDQAGALFDDVIVSIHAAPPAPVLRLHLHGSPWVVSQAVTCARAAGLAQDSDSLATSAQSLTASDLALLTLLPTIQTQGGVEWLLRQGELLERLAASALNRALASASALSEREQKQLEIIGWLQRPLCVALVGPPNAGKSTLMNALADRRVSLVSSVPGTTRDWVEAAGEIHGFPVTWIDTAGLRATEDVLEQAGIERTMAIVREADLTVVVLDLTREGIAAAGEFAQAYRDMRPALIAACKADLPQAEAPPKLPWACPRVSVSALTGVGMTALLDAVLAAVGRDASILTA